MSNMSKVALQVFTRLIRLYPLQFRRRYGAEIIDVIAHRLHERDGQGTSSEVALIVTEIIGILVGAANQHHFAVIHRKGGNPLTRADRAFMCLLATGLAVLSAAAVARTGSFASPVSFTILAMVFTVCSVALGALATGTSRSGRLAVVAALLGALVIAAAVAPAVDDVLLDALSRDRRHVDLGMGYHVISIAADSPSAASETMVVRGDEAEAVAVRLHERSRSGDGWFMVLRQGSFLWSIAHSALVAALWSTAMLAAGHLAARRSSRPGFSPVR